MYPTLPLYTPRGPGSRVSMISTVRNFGAPVMDPGGNAAATHAAVGTPALFVPRTVDTSWCTEAYDSIFIRPGTRTVPGTHTRPRSFLSKSTIIKFSARSLTDVASFEASETSASHPKG